ncbi:MAG: TonB-dependent receptor plug domain-containing protein, partial [Myxococcales bacterium]
DPIAQTSAARTPPTGVIGQLPAPFAGSQVASGARVGFLGNRSVFDTPFNITSYTNKLIRDQQARTVADVADNDPSVRTNSPRYSGIDGFLIRGFPVFAGDFAFDGLYGVVDWRSPAIEPIERVEILKGPNALLNGVPPLGTVGGAVNLIPKRATDAPLTRVTAGFVSRGQPGTHVDVGRRFGANNEWGVRFNGAYRNGGTPINFQDEEFGVGALALDYRGGSVRVFPNTVLSLSPRGSEVRLLKGKVWCEIERVGEGFRVRTADAEARVIGTSFVVEAQPGKATEVRVVHGEVEVEDLQGRGRVAVRANEKSRVPAGEAPSPVTRYSPQEDVSAWERLLRDLGRAIERGLRRAGEFIGDVLKK